MTWRGVRNWPSLARLPDLAQHVLEEITLGVGVHLLQMQVVHQADDLREHRRLVDDEARTGHEVGDALCRDARVEREDLLADPRDQPLAVQGVGPGGPAQVSLGTVSSPSARALREFRKTHSPRRHSRSPPPRTARGAHSGRIGRLEHVEEEEIAELLGVLGRVGKAAAEEVVADAVDAAAKLGVNGMGCTDS